MSELQDILIRDSDKQFRIRISPSLRGTGILQLIGTKDYLDIDFIGGDCITVFYPNKFENLPEVAESELLLETQLSRRQINNIKCHVKDYIEEIESTLTDLIQMSKTAA